VVTENIAQLVAQRNAVAAPLKVLVTCCSTSDKQATMRSLEKMVDGFSFTKIHNWGTEKQNSRQGRLRKPCSRLWKNITILASGDVALCCLDYDGQHLLGNLADGGSIRETWNNSLYREVRNWHRAAKQQKIPLCANCTKSFLL
ncbi:MAG: SPASM domain-containing protein, partial [Thermoguttaceae bacterium]